MKRLSGILLIYAATFLATTGNSTLSILIRPFLNQAITGISDTLDLGSLIRVSRFRLEIIPPSSGIQFYRNGIVFLSNSRAEGKMLESHISFGTVEAYYAAFRDTSLGDHVLFSPSSVWTIPCDAITFNSDYSVMYFTKKPSNREDEKIFQAKYQIIKTGESEWVSDSKPLSFCNNKSTYSNPALSPDGEKIVFTSNTSGGIGGFDLYISTKDNIGWSSPINLGNKINTQGNEMFPFLDQENNLYFSSDGIKGFGGYDIYFCQYNGTGWDKPVNLSHVINTSDDDLAFTLSRLDGKTAFFTRRRTSGSTSVRLIKVVFRDQYALNRLTYLSNAFKYLARAESNTDETVTATAGKQADLMPAEQKPVTRPVQQQKISDVPGEPAKQAVGLVAAGSDVIVYRVQFLTSSKSHGKDEISVAGKQYETFEYFYNGAYRLCAGNFSSSSMAFDLQKKMKQTGYSDAFVVTFKNNVRSTEPFYPDTKSQTGGGKVQTTDASQPQRSEIKKEVVIPPVETVAQSGGAVIYRVQFSMGSKPRGSYEITVAGKKYTTYEYQYNGAYRSCAGEFTTFASAAELQKIMNKQGYPDAFIVAFKNNVRTLDPELFKR